MVRGSSSEGQRVPAPPRCRRRHTLPADCHAAQITRNALSTRKESCPEINEERFFRGGGDRYHRTEPHVGRHVQFQDSAVLEGDGNRKIGNRVAKEDPGQGGEERNEMK